MEKLQITIGFDDANKSNYSVLNHREYIFKFQDNYYNLRVEINNQNIYFIISNLKIQ